MQVSQAASLISKVVRPAGLSHYIRRPLKDNPFNDLSSEGENELFPCMSLGER